MKYNCGMYGGSFNPLHLGHVHCIIQAANQCKRMIIVISHGTNRDEIDIKIRYRWIYQLTKHMGHITIFTLSDDAKTKDAYGEKDWYHDAALVKAFAGETIDAVFCGNDYTASSFWGKCYPDAVLNIIPRNHISSTAIRENVFASWNDLPNIVKPFFTKRILLIGGESTGKSTLTINLAHYYNTNYLEEVGRDISQRSGTDLMMIADDFTDILLQHKIRETEALQQSNRILFEDTDCLTTLFYLRFLSIENHAENTELADAIALLNSYDLILFLEPDVAFVQDGDRSTVIAAEREKYSRQIKAIYLKHGFSFQSISGNYQQRFNMAVSLVDQLMKGADSDEHNK